MRILILAVAALAATGGPALSEIKALNGWLTLQAPTARDHIVFDGAAWRCKADTCRAPSVKALPPMRSCRRLARELGPISGFGYRGVAFSAEELAACNGVLAAR